MMAANAALVLQGMHSHVQSDLHAMNYARQTDQFGYDRAALIRLHLVDLDNLYKIIAIDLEERGITPTMGQTYEETSHL